MRSEGSACGVHAAEAIASANVVAPFANARRLGSGVGLRVRRASTRVGTQRVHDDHDDAGTMGPGPRAPRRILVPARRRGQEEKDESANAGDSRGHVRDGNTQGVPCRNA